MATSTGTRQTLKRFKRVWKELDYAQRRLFEIRTGIPVTSRQRPGASHDKRDALSALEGHAARP